jgi:hypothetical protein
MKLIIFFLITIVNGYILPKQRSLVIMKSDKCFEQKYNYLKKKIQRLEGIKRKIIDLTNDNFRIIKQLIDEDVPEIITIENKYSTEWDFYNETWKKA